MPLARVGVEHNGLGDGQERRGNKALQGAVHHQFRQAVGECAHQRCNGETGNRAQEHDLAAKALAEPAG